MSSMYSPSLSAERAHYCTLGSFSRDFYDRKLEDLRARSPPYPGKRVRPSLGSDPSLVSSELHSSVLNRIHSTSKLEELARGHIP